MTQLAMNFDAPTLASARVARDIGMACVSAKAEREEPGFAELAYAFLEQWARTCPLVNPEDVTDAAAEQGIAADEPRAWGGVFLRAVRRGLIERSTVPYQRRKGHATTALLWRSLVAA